MSNLAGLDHARIGADDLFHLPIRVETMEIEEFDPFSAQPCKALVQFSLDMRGAVVEIAPGLRVA